MSIVQRVRDILNMSFEDDDIDPTQATLRSVTEDRWVLTVEGADPEPGVSLMVYSGDRTYLLVDITEELADATKVTRLDG